MARVTIVAVYPTVSTVSPSVVLLGLLDNDTPDPESLSVHGLLLSIGFSILDDAEDVLDGLLGPSTYWIGNERCHA